jgi:hypothetical protein
LSLSDGCQSKNTGHYFFCTHQAIHLIQEE